MTTELARPAQPSALPPRRTRPDFRHGKVKGLKFGDFTAPAGYPNPYPEPYTPPLPLAGHPLPLDALYAREGDVRAPRPLPAVNAGTPGGGGASVEESERVAYQTSHESRAWVFRIHRPSMPSHAMTYPRYPWNDDGTLCAPPPEWGLGGLAGDGSALPEGAAVRMTRHYFYLQNQVENYACDLRAHTFTVRRRDGEVVTYALPPFGDEVAEEGGSHGEQEWTPAPGDEAVYYWPVCLDPVTVGNLGGAMNVEKQGDEPIFLTAMQGWLIRPTQDPPAIKFYEGPYVSHETLAYYHGPAAVYPGFDRNRIALIAWWMPPKLREYRVYDGAGRLIRTCATGSDRVHMAWGDHGNYIIGDSGYDWAHPGTMTVFFPDSGAIRPIGFHDNAYFGQKGTEHPHPAVSPDGTKLIYKATHMDRLHGLEIMVIRPPRAPEASVTAARSSVGSSAAGELTWTVPGVNSEIGAFRIFHSAESGRGYRFVAEVRDARSPQGKLEIADEGAEEYRHRWPIPADLSGYFVVCSVEGSGLMSPPSNEVVVGAAGGPRRLFVRCEDLIADRPTAYVTPDGEAASWAVVRQATVELRDGETPPGDPHLAYDLPGSGPYTVYVRLRGRGAVDFGPHGTLRAASDAYTWQRLGRVSGARWEAVARIDEGVRLDQLCFTEDESFVPAGNGPLDLTPGAPRGLRVTPVDGQEGVVELAWESAAGVPAKEYHVYALPADAPAAESGEAPDQRWRVCTVKEPRALDWNVPAGPVRYCVTAAGWDMSESSASDYVTFGARGR